MQARSPASGEPLHETAMHASFFPPALRATVAHLLSEWSATATFSTDAGFCVHLGCDPLTAPARLYCPPAALRTAVAALSGDARLLALCLGTRHSDGYVREACLLQLAGADRDWVTPFVVALLGDYVASIATIAATAITSMPSELLAGLACANPAFLDTTRSRAANYWHCYYRHSYPMLRYYPPAKAIECIVALARKARNRCPTSQTARSRQAARA